LQCYIFALYHTILIPHEIKNIIFDLGGVILDLDVARTHRAFGELGGFSTAEIQSMAASEVFFNDFEKGLLSDKQFRDTTRAFLKTNASDEEIDAAWNAMLLKISPEKYPLLEVLKTKYQVFLLSNTNTIHLQHFNELVRHDTGRSELDFYFHKAYYSHRMNMRKPDTEIYVHVIGENKLTPKETLFLDDNVDNLKTAAAMGIQTIHVTSPEMILSLFA